MNSQSSLENVEYICDEDLWFLPPCIQLEIFCYWESKINEHDKKLYYINPKIAYK